MKTVVSILICRRVESVPAEPDGCELLYTDENRSYTEILKNGIKQAKGKYSIILDGGFEFADADGLVSALSAANADIVTFKSVTAFKTSLFKGANFDTGDRAASEIYAALSSKSLVKSEVSPFICVKKAEKYSEQAEKAILEVIKEFTKNKAKLTKEVYSYCFDSICLRLTEFYIAALLAVKNKEIPSEKLAVFDGEIKKNVVLCLAFEKRFTYADLKRLRKNNFKISFITAKKLEKIINI